MERYREYDDGSLLRAEARASLGKSNPCYGFPQHGIPLSLGFSPSNHRYKSIFLTLSRRTNRELKDELCKHLLLYAIKSPNLQASKQKAYCLLGLLVTKCGG
jgi:hypothetical protein